MKWFHESRTDSAFLSLQDDLCDYMIGLVEDDEAALISGEVWLAYTIIYCFIISTLLPLMLASNLSMKYLQYIFSNVLQTEKIFIVIICTALGNQPLFYF